MGAAGAWATAIDEVAAGLVEERIRGFARGCRRIVVYWSGGKDSTAALLASARALGYRPPALTAVVPGQSSVGFLVGLARAAGYRPVLTRPRVQPRLEPGDAYLILPPYRTSFWDEIEKRGLPAEPGGRKRWCCSMFKSRPLESVGGYDCAVAGYKYVDSPRRRRRYRGVDARTPVVVGRGRKVLAPLLDFGDDAVWRLIRFYDERVYGVLRTWYSAKPNSPDCQLCVVAGRGVFAAAASAAPAPLLERARRALAAAALRHREGSWSRERALRMVEAIDAALALRG